MSLDCLSCRDYDNVINVFTTRVYTGIHTYASKYRPGKSVRPLNKWKCFVLLNKYKDTKYVTRHINYTRPNNNSRIIVNDLIKKYRLI